MSVDHYENFPVASVLLPKALRPAVTAIYHFARTADDIADEGDAPAADRLNALARYGDALEAIENSRGLNLPQPGPAPEPAKVFGPLQQAIARHQLPIEPFHRLLWAFRHDVGVKRHADVDAVLAYCNGSANPVGELVLHLYDQCSPDNLRDSNFICTGLQLANFCQDVDLDERKGRVYIPLSELRRFEVSETDLRAQRHTPAWRALMRSQVAQARHMLCRGAALARRLPGRIGWELRLVVCGGLRILERIEAVHYNVFDARPILTRRDWLIVAYNALFYTRATTPAHQPEPQPS